MSLNPFDIDVPQVPVYEPEPTEDPQAVGMEEADRARRIEQMRRGRDSLVIQPGLATDKDGLKI